MHSLGTWAFKTEIEHDFYMDRVHCKSYLFFVKTRVYFLSLGTTSRLVSVLEMLQHGSFLGKKQRTRRALKDTDTLGQ